MKFDDLPFVVKIIVIVICIPIFLILGLLYCIFCDIYEKTFHRGRYEEREHYRSYY